MDDSVRHRNAIIGVLECGQVLGHDVAHVAGKDVRLIDLLDIPKTGEKIRFLQALAHALGDELLEYPLVHGHSLASRPLGSG
ncbi:hypothetical protein GOHSU_38_00310 [Gordonia hirsuta DSM 44140 = NBRC 16056]|uniref:Uncharacterized protein n=1 Tax=Gordonia hirsuta DSM 44140 = NBRC 16056 TaxID=1121927 RepID=L7LE98_9ACTN|nr:hypothetical protein GOHSU_38_00310 [Gordonia hirsuta DSM 44140 = NBRC 16056]